jgi:choline dehydrogenase
MKVQTGRIPESTGTLVVGGGTAGAAFAGLLAERSDEPVLLLESGPDYGSFADGRWPKDLLDAKRVTRSHDWWYSTGATHSSKVLDLPRARVLGGCSSHNGCTAAVGARVDYDNWQAAGNPHWSAAELEPLFTLVRNRFRVGTCALDELAPIQSAFVTAGRDCGLPLAFDLDQYEAGVGIGPMAANIVAGVRWNAAFAFLDPVRHRSNLTVAGEVLVDRLIVEGGRAVGASVTSSGVQSIIRADRVVLCAGAFGSPTILLRSGIGPAADSTRLGLPVESDLSGVGHNLLDHPVISLTFAGTERFADAVRATRWHPDEQALGRVKSPFCDTGPYDVHLYLSAGIVGQSTPVIALCAGAMLARSRGVLRLRDTNPVRLPLIDPGYLSDPEQLDRRMLEYGREQLRALAGCADLAAFLGEQIGGQADVAAGVFSYCHPSGTCKMGPESDPAAVVDSRGRVYGVGGLHVADASIMPTNIRGNINLPTAMIAARLAVELTPGAGSR